MKSKGFAYENDGHFHEIEFNRHDPKEHDIVIDIIYAGICHSDIHTVYQHWGKVKLPLIPGHEILGVVTEVGPEVTKFKVGDYAGIGCLVGSCHHCSACDNDEEQYCENGAVLTYASNDQYNNGEYTQGGYSINYVVDERMAIKVPKGVDYKRIPSLMCAGITTYSPIRQSKVQSGWKCAVIGFGGLGHMAVKYLKSIGAEVDTYDIVDKENKLGTNFTKVTKSTKLPKHKYDFIISTVPYYYDLKDYIGMAKRHSDFAIVGLPPYNNTPDIDVTDIVIKYPGVHIYGSQIGGIKETQECVDYSLAHDIYPDVVLIEPTAESIEKAYKNVIDGKVEFRYCINMKDFNKEISKHQEGGSMGKIKISIGDKEYTVREALSPEDKQKGIMGVSELPANEGMIFYWDPPQRVEMWMHNTSIPLDIVFIDDNQEVIDVKQGQPNDDTLLGCDNVAYVVEVNQNSGIQKGDILEFSDDEGPVMKILAPDGSTQMELWGGERIVSRKETKVLIRKAIKAYKSQNESDYKSLGKYMFKVLEKQDSRKPEYVSLKNT